MSPAIQEPLPLVRRAEQHDRWFEQEPPSSPSRSSLEVAPLVADDESGWVAGFFAGAIATSLGLLTSAIVGTASAVGAPIEAVVGAALTRHQLASATSATFGFAVMLLVGALVGAAVSRLTRHVTRVMPMVIFGMLFAPTLWFAVDVLVLRRFAPHAAHAAPLGATLLGAGVYGIALALAVPLRRRA